MEVEGNDLATIADLPRLRQLGNDLEGHGVVGAGAHQAIIGWSSGGIDATKGSLMHVVVRDLLIARTEKLAAVAGLVTLCPCQDQWPLPQHLTTPLPA